MAEETTPSSYGAALGAKMQQRRVYLGKTRQEVAIKARVNVRTIEKYEQGAVEEPGFYKLSRILRALGMSILEVEEDANGARNDAQLAVEVDAIAARVAELREAASRRPARTPSPQRRGAEG